MTWPLSISQLRCDNNALHSDDSRVFPGRKASSTSRCLHPGWSQRWSNTSRISSTTCAGSRGIGLCAVTKFMPLPCPALKICRCMCLNAERKENNSDRGNFCSRLNASSTQRRSLGSSNLRQMCNGATARCVFRYSFFARFCRKNCSASAYDTGPSSSAFGSFNVYTVRLRLASRQASTRDSSRRVSMRER